MADQADGIDEALEATLRVAMTVAGRMAETRARAREQQQRDAQAASQQDGRELAARLTAERAAARAALAPVEREEWWQRAQPAEIAHAWETANAWKEIDPDVARTVDRLRGQVRERYGLDVENLAADPSAVAAALAARDRDDRSAIAERANARSEQTEATLLLAAADRADHDAETGQRDAVEDAGLHVYDSAERREQLAASLESSADAETIEAGVVADTNQAHPARDAVAATPSRASVAMRSRGKTGLTRGMPARNDRDR